MVSLYKRLPSELIGIDDDYTAYCFNEACSVIIARLKKDEKPIFKQKFKSFSDMYKGIS